MNSTLAAAPKLTCRLKARDPHAMAELYDLYGRLVLRVIWRVVGNQSSAEDLTQEAFLRIWNGIRGFDETRGPLRSWIVAVARNVAIDYLRSPGARSARSSVGLTCVESASRLSPFHDWILHFDRGRILHKAFERLTASQRLVLNLCYVEGMSHAEIARRLNRPLGTVKTWVRTALRVLSAQIATSC